MQITEKTRNDTAMFLPILGTSDADKIATNCHVGRDTVYRAWRKMHGRTAGKLLQTDTVVISLIELAATRKGEAKKLNRRLRKSMKQLSEA